MKLDQFGNFEPWRQPLYGHDAYEKAVPPPPDGFRIIAEGDPIPMGTLVWDVYAGWMASGSYHAERGCHARSHGRWTTWAAPVTQ